MELKFKKPEIIAFYLPQFHPIKENDEWYGKGFTEWTNVGKAKPLFKGHYQPRIPADLGYYDLRIPEVREEQAKLAREAGISGFCYYHYWFGNGKTIMDMPIMEVVKLGKPNFPFCLCWANHSWARKEWNVTIGKLEQEILVEQTYPGHDDIVAQFNHLLPIFKDDRYITVKGKLLYVLYDITSIPYLDDFISTWNTMAKESGLNGFYFVGYTKLRRHIHNSQFAKCDSTIIELMDEIDLRQWSKIRNLYRRVRSMISKLTGRPLNIHKYEDAMQYTKNPIFKDSDNIPLIIPNWDWTPRRGIGSLIYTDSTPKKFKKHAKEILDLVINKPSHKQLVFLKSWNEWGEGNYMEPDLKFGKGYINALREVLEEMPINL